jgi:hypothetical protein
MGFVSPLVSEPYRIIAHFFIEGFSGADLTAGLFGFSGRGVFAILGVIYLLDHEIVPAMPALFRKPS